MDASTFVAQRVLLPIYERRWGVHSGSLLSELNDSQYLSPDEIHARQWTRLVDMLAHAGRENPFYRERLDGLDPRDIRTPEDLQRLPVLSKQDLRERQDDLITRGYSRAAMFHKRTGGSTGLPVHLYWDGAAHRFKRAIVKRHDAWAGFATGMKLGALWGDTDKNYPLKERVFKRLCERTVFLDTLKMDESTLLGYVDELRRHAPTILMGHAHSIFFFTQFLAEKGIDDLRFDGIISTAETLLPAERTAIEKFFGPVLFDRYGCEELSIIASECEAHDGLHIAGEGLYVEVLDGDETTPGRLVVTDLINRGFPLIRYEVGDLATVAQGPCRCGRGLPRLRRVFGRTSDILYTPEGARVSGVSILDTFLIHVPGIRQAQIEQNQKDHVLIRVVGDDDFGGSSQAELGRIVREVFGPTMRYEMELVDRIEPTARGKYQFTICNIEPVSS